MQTYPASMHAATAPGSLAAAKRILPILWSLKAFQNVIDVGCGSGGWLRVAQDLGASRVVGVEAPSSENRQSFVPLDAVLEADLTKPLLVTGPFDLCICLEVAEHLPKELARTLIDSLVASANIVLFSAAIPFQGGYGHINEQWPQFWASIFARHGFELWDGIRKEVWMDRKIPWWYRQNVMLFVHNSVWEEVLPGRGRADQEQLAVVHPECFLFRKDDRALTALYKSAKKRKGPLQGGTC